MGHRGRDAGVSASHGHANTDADNHSDTHADGHPYSCTANSNSDLDPYAHAYADFHACTYGYASTADNHLNRFP